MQITMGFLRIKKNTHNINWIFLNPIKYNIKSKSHQCKNFRLGEPSNKNLTFLAEMSAIFVFVRGGAAKILVISLKTEISFKYFSFATQDFYDFIFFRFRLLSFQKLIFVYTKNKKGM